jgi:hypothetical protein
VSEPEKVCRAGEQARNVLNRQLCCDAGNTCFDYAEARAGDACNASPSVTAHRYRVTFDQCVQALAGGDRVAREFADSVHQDTGTLVCDQGRWRWGAMTALHDITRGCAPGRPLPWGYGGYGYGDGGGNYGSYDGGYGYGGYGYGGYGYGGNGYGDYGYGGNGYGDYGYSGNGYGDYGYGGNGYGDYGYGGNGYGSYGYGYYGGYAYDDGYGYSDGGRSYGGYADCGNGPGYGADGGVGRQLRALILISSVCRTPVGAERSCPPILR